VKKGEKLEVVRRSENVFHDLGHKSADAEQFKALGREDLSVSAAHGRTRSAAADFSRIRNADLGRFTVDRLMSILKRLGARVEVKVRVRNMSALRPIRNERSAPIRHLGYPERQLRRMSLTVLVNH
jgi:hypothetical protein